MPSSPGSRASTTPGCASTSTPGSTFEEFFAAADLNPKVSHITGVICGVRIESIENPLMQQVRYLDKLVDELAKGRPMEKVLRENV